MLANFMKGGTRGGISESLANMESFKAGLHDHIYVKFTSHFLCDHRM